MANVSNSRSWLYSAGVGELIDVLREMNDSKMQAEISTRKIYFLQRMEAMKVKQYERKEQREMWKDWQSLRELIYDLYGFFERDLQQ